MGKSPQVPYSARQSDQPSAKDAVKSSRFASTSGGGINAFLDPTPSITPSVTLKPIDPSLTPTPTSTPSISSTPVASISVTPSITPTPTPSITPSS